MTLRQLLLRAARSVATIFAGVALGLPALLWWRQDSLIFRPPEAPATAPRAVGRTVEAVRIPVASGLVLGGWLSRPAAAGQTPLPIALYFGGNAEEVSWMAEMSARFPGWALLAVNYRGYGGNPGAPGEQALVDDAIAIHDWARARQDVAGGRVVAIGRSLGSGVAVQLAAARVLAGVVLVTPFDSLRQVAARMYPFIPVGMLLRHPFDSLLRADAVKAPLLCLVAGEDQLIPPSDSRRLYDAWRGPKEWRLVPRTGHESIDADDAYWNAIAAFLASR